MDLSSQTTTLGCFGTLLELKGKTGACKETKNTLEISGGFVVHPSEQNLSNRLLQNLIMRSKLKFESDCLNVVTGLDRSKILFTKINQQAGPGLSHNCCFHETRPGNGLCLFIFNIRLKKVLSESSALVMNLKRDLERKEKGYTDLQDRLSDAMKQLQQVQSEVCSQLRYFFYKILLGFLLLKFVFLKPYL